MPVVSVKQPKIGVDIDDSSLDDILSRALALRDAMSASVQAYEPGMVKHERATSPSIVELSTGASKQGVHSREPPSIEQLVLAGTHQGGMTAKETRRHYLAMEDGSSVENPLMLQTTDGHSGSEQAEAPSVLSRFQ